MEEVRSLLTIISLLAGLVSGAMTGLVAIAGLWFTVKYQIRNHEDRFDRMEKLLTNGNGLLQRVERVEKTQDTLVTKERFESVMFNGPSNVVGQVETLRDRQTHIEATCRAAHAKLGVPDCRQPEAAR